MHVIDNCNSMDQRHTYHKWMSSSRFVSAELLYFNIFVIADIAFSVGFIFSGSRLLGVLIISTKTGTHWAQGTANWLPPNYEIEIRVL